MKFLCIRPKKLSIQSCLIAILITSFFSFCKFYCIKRWEDEAMKNIILKKVLLPNDNNIFFIETSCALKEDKFFADGLQISSRQACAIYSTAKMNPSRPVILYHSCPLLKNYYESSSEAALHILKLKNVYILNEKYEDILRGSLVENLISSNKLQESKYLYKHASDVLGLVLLYKYGGAYMDMNFITRKSFDTLPKNVLTPLSYKNLSSGFMQFEQKGFGNEFLKQILIDLSKNFSKTRWDGNGAFLIGERFLKFCQYPEDKSLKEAIANNSCDIALNKIEEFYPIYFTDWEYLFKPNNHTKHILNALNNSIAVSFWNFISRNEEIKIGENSVFEILAWQYCHDIIKSTGQSF
ncbi:hypothetical protein O3M35_011754 [Rhynocoris fuscipes]|uniref:Alpha 1,4-glycosyltransferase domain-containing protein n=1 Tax=Rhynocoris fuscipes TaxID=488301 RepID=A0AAW1CYQ4_9HEMI